MPPPSRYGGNAAREGAYPGIELLSPGYPEFERHSQSAAPSRPPPASRYPGNNPAYAAPPPARAAAPPPGNYAGDSYSADSYGGGYRGGGNQEYYSSRSSGNQEYYSTRGGNQSGYGGYSSYPSALKKADQAVGPVVPVSNADSSAATATLAVSTGGSTSDAVPMLAVSNADGWTASPVASAPSVEVSSSGSNAMHSAAVAASDLRVARVLHTSVGDSSAEMAVASILPTPASPAESLLGDATLLVGLLCGCVAAAVAGVQGKGTAA